jgi:hypothetical protein
MPQEHARVIGCLSPGTIDVVLVPGDHESSPVRLEIALVPPELRLPNCELLLDLKGCVVVSAEGDGKPYSPAPNS